MQGLPGALFTNYERAARLILANISSGSRYSSDEESDDDMPSDLRGRAYLQKNIKSNSVDVDSSKRRPSPHEGSSGDSAATAKARHSHKRTSFTRSRSPAVLRAPTSMKSLNRHLSPIVVRNNPRQISDLAEPQSLLPAGLRFQLRVPLSSWTCLFCIDTRKLGESLLLLISLLCASYCIAGYPTPNIPLLLNPETHVWLAFGKFDYYSLQQLLFMPKLRAGLQSSV